MKSPDHVNIDSENSLYLVSNDVDGYIIKESNEDQYLILAFTDKNEKVLEKYTELWNEKQIQIETINGGECNSTEPIKYKRDFMKIRLESGDDLPLGKILNISVMVITGSVFQEGNKCYPQVLSCDCVYKSVDKL